MTPNEALRTRVQMNEGFGRMVQDLKDRSGPWKVIATGEAELDMLAVADLFIWRGELLKVSAAAASTLPAPVTFTRELMPTVAGLYLFDEPIVFEGAKLPTLGVAWHPFGGDKHTALWLYTTPGPLAPSLGPLATQTQLILQNGVDVLTAFAEHHGDMRELQTDKEFESRIGGEAVLRFLIASWLWLKQRVMVAEPAAVSSKAERQAERARTPTTVNVITLRRTIDGSRPEEPRAVDWEHQWMVRGHWRQQFYPSTQERRPIWIHPHLKGPDDKPFKFPSDTVFKVDR